MRLKLKIIVIIIGILFPLLTFGQASVLLQQARIDFDNYNRSVSNGRPGRSAYESAYKAVEGYKRAINQVSSSSPEYAECRKALRELFPVMGDGAYFFADLGLQDKVLQYSCAYIDISLLSAFSDEKFYNAQLYPTLSHLASTNLYNRGEYERAIDYFKAYLNTSDLQNREMAFEGLARCYYELKDWGWAGYIASQGVQYYPQNWNMLLIGIESFGHSKNDDKMEPLLSQALSLYPDHPGLMEYQGKLYERQKRFEEASKVFEKLTGINNQNLDYALHLGFNLYNMGSFLLLQAKSQGITKTEAAQLEAKAKLFFTKAAPVLKQVLENSPYAANVAHALALCYAATNDHERLKEANRSLTAMRVAEVSGSEIPMLDMSYRPMVELTPVNNQGMASNSSFSTDRPQSDVDINIPLNSKKNEKTYAVIIGNENYKRIAKVPYAQNDARVFAEYCKKVLGIPEDHIRECYDATLTEIKEQINYLTKRTSINPDELNIIFYYSGHGTMDYTDRSSYLLPVDASGTDMEGCYALNALCDQFDNMKARKVTLFLDACFTGEAKTEESLIAGARLVTYEPEDVVAKGNTVVFSATAEKQVALPYDEQGHGFFTYYLLKSLQESKGNIDYKTLADKLEKQVDAKVLDIKNKRQTPSVRASSSIGDSWHSYTFF